jgi:Protein of unknown function (DUF4019)
MKINQSFFAVLCAFFIFLLCIPALGSEKAEKKALEASQIWLTLVDKGQYAESWETAAQYFRNAVSKEQWQQSLSAVRKPLGPVVKRTLKSKRYATSLPGAPDGEYVVIQYETSFANKKSSIETIAPMLDKDGRWRVSGYYIK